MRQFTANLESLVPSDVLGEVFNQTLDFWFNDINMAAHNLNMRYFEAVASHVKLVSVQPKLVRLQY